MDFSPNFLSDQGFQGCNAASTATKSIDRVKENRTMFPETNDAGWPPKPNIRARISSSVTCTSVKERTSTEREQNDIQCLLHDSLSNLSLNLGGVEESSERDLSNSSKSYYPKASLLAEERLSCGDVDSYFSKASNRRPDSESELQFPPLSIVCNAYEDDEDSHGIDQTQSERETSRGTRLSRGNSFSIKKSYKSSRRASLPSLKRDSMTTVSSSDSRTRRNSLRRASITSVDTAMYSCQGDDMHDSTASFATALDDSYNDSLFTSFRNGVNLEDGVVEEEQNYAEEKQEEHDSSGHDRSGAILIEVYPGEKRPLRGAHATWEALQSNDVDAVSCTLCTASLKCIRDAEYVMCPICRSIGPAIHEQAKEEEEVFMNEASKQKTSGLWGVGLGVLEDDIFLYSFEKTFNSWGDMLG